MTARLLALLLIVLFAAGALTGCAPGTDDGPDGFAVTSTAAPDAGDDDELFPTPGNPEAIVGDRFAEPGREPARVAAAYANAATNWSWRNYREQYQVLLDLSAGKLNNDLQGTRPTADEIAGLRAERTVNAANVLSVQTTDITGNTATVILALAETRGGRAGIEPEIDHTVTRAQARKTPNGWRVTRWEPLP